MTITIAGSIRGGYKRDTFEAVRDLAVHHEPANRTNFADRSHLGFINKAPT